MKHTDWMNATTGNESVRATALKAGLAQRTLANQVEKERISPENVIAIAKTYNTHPVRALVDTGYLDEEYARQVDAASAIRMVTEEQLANEVLYRMKLGLKTSALTTGIDDLASRRAGAPVSDTDDSLHDDDDGIVREFDYSPDEYAADSSPNEQEEREKRGEDPID